METHVYHCLDGNHVLGLVKTSLLLLARSTVYWSSHVEGLLNTCVSIVCFGLVVMLAPAGCAVARFLTVGSHCTVRLFYLIGCSLPKQHVAMVSCKLHIIYQHFQVFSGIPQHFFLIFIRVFLLVRKGRELK